MSDAILKEVLGGLMSRYRERVPDVSKIVSAMQQHGIIQSYEDIENYIYRYLAAL